MSTWQTSAAQKSLALRHAWTCMWHCQGWYSTCTGRAGIPVCPRVCDLVPRLWAPGQTGLAAQYMGQVEFVQKRRWVAIVRQLQVILFWNKQCTNITPDEWPLFTCSMQSPSPIWPGAKQSIVQNFQLASCGHALSTTSICGTKFRLPNLPCVGSLSHQV